MPAHEAAGASFRDSEGVRLSHPRGRDRCSASWLKSGYICPFALLRGCFERYPGVQWGAWPQAVDVV